MTHHTASASVITLPAPKREGPALPDRIKVLAWGENPNARGQRICLGPLAIQVLGEPSFAYKRVALDYEHNTLPGSDTYRAGSEPREVAGFGDIEIIPGDGAYLTNISYTDNGKANAGNYIDVSAGVIPDQDGNVVMIHSVALCRNGAVPGMEFANVPVALSGTLADIITPKPQGTTMTPEQLAELLKLLGLAEDASVDDALAAIKKLKEPEPAKDPPANEDLAKRVEQLEKDNLLSQAAAEGKAVGLSADIIASLSVQQLRDHVANLKPAVPLHAITPGSVTDHGKSALTDRQREIFKACGLNPDKQ